MTFLFIFLLFFSSCLCKPHGTQNHARASLPNRWFGTSAVRTVRLPVRIKYIPKKINQVSRHSRYLLSTRGLRKLLATRLRASSLVNGAGPGVQRRAKQVTVGKRKLAPFWAKKPLE